MVQNSPGTRVNRYIGRLIEARQTESETADLNFITLTYRSKEREQRVSTHRCMRGKHVGESFKWACYLNDLLFKYSWKVNNTVFNGKLNCDNLPHIVWQHAPLLVNCIKMNCFKIQDFKGSYHCFKGSYRLFFMCSHANQACIYLIKNTIKTVILWIIAILTILNI